MQSGKEEWQPEEAKGNDDKNNIAVRRIIVFWLVDPS